MGGEEKEKGDPGRRARNKNGLAKKVQKLTRKGGTPILVKDGSSTDEAAQ